MSIYEVTEKQIADDEVLRGIVLRDEILVKSDEAGYINYYVGEGARIGCNTTVYSIDKTGQFADDLSALDMEDIALSEEDTREIRNDIASHRNGFDLSDYQSIVNFKYNKLVMDEPQQSYFKSVTVVKLLTVFIVSSIDFDILAPFIRSCSFFFISMFLLGFN